MEWTRSETLALAQHSCAQCHGLGLRASRGLDRFSPCNCVYRSIFRVCFEQFIDCATKEKHISRATLEPSHGREHAACWGRKDEEYLADFCLVSKRALTPLEYQIFRFHFLLGGSWQLCCRRLHLDRGNFFHSVYRIQQKLGRTFRELEPYGLFPVDEYFRGTAEEARARGVTGIQSWIAKRPAPAPAELRFPLRKTA